MILKTPSAGFVSALPRQATYFCVPRCRGRYSFLTEAKDMRRRWRIVGIGVAVLALCLCAGVLLFTMTRAAHPPPLPAAGQSPGGSASPDVADEGGDTTIEASTPQPNGNPAENIAIPSHTLIPRPERPADAADSSRPIPSDEEQLEQSLAKLKKGNLAYSTPDKMKSGHTAHVTARIGSENVSLQTLESGLPADGGATTATAATPVSTRMKVTLKSADFDITPLSSEEQIVAGGIPTQWEWDITPKHSGKLRLHLAATVELNNLSRDFTSVDREVTVQVDPVGLAEAFTEKNSIWILGALGTAIAAAWAWWKKRRKPTAPSWQVP
jgi:hypothetical protein